MVPLSEIDVPTIVLSKSALHADAISTSQALPSSPMKGKQTRSSLNPTDSPPHLPTRARKPSAHTLSHSHSPHKPPFPKSPLAKAMHATHAHARSEPVEFQLPSPVKRERRDGMVNEPSFEEQFPTLKRRHSTHTHPHAHTHAQPTQQQPKQQHRQQPGRKARTSVSSALPPRPAQQCKGHEMKRQEEKVSTETTSSRPEGLGFFSYLLLELDLLPKRESADTQRTPLNASNEVVEKMMRLSRFIRVPLHLERLLAFGFLICFDSFLFLFTLLPLRLALNLLRYVASGFRRSRITPVLRADLCFAFLLIVSLLCVFRLDSSFIYHTIRGQANIKFYVIYNMIDIFDKLCCSFGQDIIDSLLHLTSPRDRRLTNHPNVPKYMFSLWVVLPMAAVYTVVHTTLLLYQLVTLHVVLNSRSNAFLTLLMSIQFAEVKGNVFKKFQKENLFQICCSDIVERFQQTAYLVVIYIRSVTDQTDRSSKTGQFAVMVLLSEILVDWIKHMFVTKFNSLAPETYHSFGDILSRDLLHSFVIHQPAMLERTNQLARRIGFLPIPLAALICRYLAKSFPATARLRLPVVILLFLCCCAVKILTDILFTAYTYHRFALSKQLSVAPSPHLPPRRASFLLRRHPSFALPSTSTTASSSTQLLSSLPPPFSLPSVGPPGTPQPALLAEPLTEDFPMGLSTPTPYQSHILQMPKSHSFAAEEGGPIVHCLSSGSLCVMPQGQGEEVDGWVHTQDEVPEGKMLEPT